jgi:DNA replication protein DnaC
MESIASILRRPGVTTGNTTRSQASNGYETTEGEKNRFQIRSDQASAEKWNWNEEPPEPVKCEFCGQTLYHTGIVSVLQEKRVYAWMKEPEHCDCKKAQAYWAKVEAKKIAAEEEKKRQEKAERIQRKINKLIRESGIRGRFLNRTFDTFEITKQNRRAYEAAKRYADNFAAMLPKKSGGRIEPPQVKRNGIFTTGSCGTGKTHLVTAISNQLISKGIPVICMTMIDLLARVKQTFDRIDFNNTEADIMKIYEEVPLLVIDDLGSEQPTEWGATKIYAIVNARYEAYMPTIVTTNYAGDELIRRMTPTGVNGRPLDSRNAEKTIDRLKEMCVGIEMNWESWRSR